MMRGAGRRASRAEEPRGQVYNVQDLGLIHSKRAMTPGLEERRECDTIKRPWFPGECPSQVKIDYDVRIDVKLFAVAQQLVGRPTCNVELPVGATVADLRRELPIQFPALERILGQLRFAVDEDYAGDATPLTEGSIVACIPPVSGG